MKHIPLTSIRARRLLQQAKTEVPLRTSLNLMMCTSKQTTGAREQLSTNSYGLTRSIYRRTSANKNVPQDATLLRQSKRGRATDQSRNKVYALEWPPDFPGTERAEARSCLNIFNLSAFHDAPQEVIS